MKRAFTLFFLLLVISTSFGLGFYFSESQRPPAPIEGVINQEISQPEGVDFSLFWDTWRVLQEKHIDKGSLNIEEMVYGAIAGMVNSLDDPYTVFLKPRDTKVFEEDVSGEFEGVGMEIGIRKSRLQVISPLEGTPAMKAGLKAGDKILAIDGDSTDGITIDEAVKTIRGPRGTEVILTVLRDEWDETKDFTIVRDVIEIPSLKLEIRDDGIAHIKIYHFSQVAGREFAESAAEILKSPAEKIIVDLRNNPGGFLEVAQYISGFFLEKGDVVLIEDFGGGEKEEYKAGGHSSLLSYPVVVLINKGSASASEILAGALRDNRGILLLGETSFGKGSVQQLEKLGEGSSVKVTIARWLTPQGTLINGEGLSPDIEVEITEEDIEGELDSQLDKAVEILEGL